jgi:BirA family biotin operon repressor/biotin-[acetyl-CoA-carboxylase] ligase
MKNETMNSTFDLQRIQADTFVARIEFQPEMPSTNDLALELARQESLRVPLLALTERQTRGRGRGAKRWWSAAGGLTFSLVLDMGSGEMPIERQPQMSLTAGLAVCDALSQLHPQTDVGLKWPNDVYFGRRKICGILIEVPSRPKGRMVVGVGINVNNSFAHVPAELRGSATSLYDATGRRFDLNVVLIHFLQSLSADLELLKSDPARVRQRWQQCCILTGRTVRVGQGQRQIRGICQGIDDDGALLVRNDAGIERCVGGEIQELALSDARMERGNSAC